MPGANVRALAKARDLPADALIFDLEDAVAPGAKETARDNVAQALHGGGYGYRELIVRVNGLDTPWGLGDVARFARADVAGLLFPKVSSVDEVARIVAAVDAAGGARLPIWIMIETPAGVLNVRVLLGASQRIAVVVMGTSDLVNELRAAHTPTRHNLAYALQRCVLAAREAGVDVLDGVHLDFRNRETFSAACEDARAMGFDGKTLIHPTQIETANEVFGPDPDAVSHARSVLEAWEQANASGRGVAELNGQLIENLHAEDARRTLSYAQAIAARVAKPLA